MSYRNNKIIPCVFVIFSLNSLNVILTWSCIVRKDVCLFILKIFGLNHNNNNTNFVFKGFFYVETLKVFGKTTWQKLSFSCHPKRSLLFSQNPSFLCRVILFLQEVFRMFSEFLSLGYQFNQIVSRYSSSLFLIDCIITHKLVKCLFFIESVLFLFIKKVFKCSIHHLLWIVSVTTHVSFSISVCSLMISDEVLMGLY